MNKDVALIIVPHQDDEINLCGNILDVIVENWDLYIVYSSLDSRKQYGLQRKKEAIEACGVWGIDKDHIIFLEYPDTPNISMIHFFNDNPSAIISDIYNIIEKLRPSIFFVVDFDFHSDHRMLSITFEKAMGKILKDFPAYEPLVFKGFCYETAYYGVEDYCASMLKECVPTERNLSNPSWEWQKRISIQSVDNNRFIWKRKAFKALSKHKSQYATLHAKSIINSDNVFWIKRTDNLLKKAIITASSGETQKLTDFMVLDTNDIITLDHYNIDYSKALWIPYDNRPYIRINFVTPVVADKLVLHGSINSSVDISIHIQILINDRETIGMNSIRSYARATEVQINRQLISTILIMFNESCSLSEIELFDGEMTIPEVLKIKSCRLFPKENRFINIANNCVYHIICILTKIRRKMQYAIEIMRMHWTDS